jgi:alkanesulfonate monooxygenase SsuD/methylene tetrahydromethanopterin reductase-like flavin-dependent oxidoreductase (luciferase family)
VLLGAWTQDAVESQVRWFPFPATTVHPRPRTRPHPPLYLATSTPSGIERAARDRLPLLHYWGTPVAPRQRVEARYAEALARVGGGPPVHVHSLIVLVADDERRTRHMLHEHLIASFRAGDWPHVPQAQNRHVGPDGTPLDRDARASAVAAQAIVGPPAAVAAGLQAFCEQTQAHRLVLFMEPIVERNALLVSIERFAREVAPAFTSPTARENRPC